MNTNALLTVCTALHSAASCGHAETFLVLVSELDVDVNAKCSGSRTSLHYASLHGRTETVRVLVKEFGADVNAEDLEKETPLHLAVFYGYTEIARVFVEQGADVNAKDSDGKTPFSPVDENEHGHREELRALLLQQYALTKLIPTTCERCG